MHVQLVTGEEIEAVLKRIYSHSRAGHRTRQTGGQVARYLVLRIMRASAMRSTSTAPSVIIMLR